MAASTDPLQRASLGIVSQDTGDRLTAPNSNGALKLASALGDLQPAAAQLSDALATQESKKAFELAHRDAIRANGERFADAVREGKIEPTQNPWYMTAYTRESAAIRAHAQLQQLQVASASWDTKNDPAAFEKQWMAEVGQLAGSYEDHDEAAGFTAAEGQVTPGVIQANTSQNVQRIQLERTQNLSSLAADSIATVTRTKGGVITTADLLAALQPSRDQWLKTGGTKEAWNNIAVGAITTAAEKTSNPGLLDAAKGIGVDGTAAGAPEETWGSGTTPSLPSMPLPVAGGGGGGAPGSGAPAPLPRAAPTAPITAPLHGLPAAGPVTGHFGDAREGHLHNGIDIAAPHGSPIQPRAGGTVTVGYDPQSGNFVKVDHGGGVVSSYAHMGNVAVKTGDTIVAGQTIGTVGNTGHVVSSSGGDGSHLHYVLRVDGQAVDPLKHQFNPAAASSIPPAQTASAEPVAGPPVGGPPAAEAAPPEPTRAPSLYDMAGIAPDIETTRYRITQAQAEGATARLRAIAANREEEGIAVQNALFTKYGPDILKGNYDVNKIIDELHAAGWSTEAIGEGLKQVRGAVGESAALQQAHHTLNSDNPDQAQRLFAIAAEGRTKGFSDDYQNRINTLVHNGDLTLEEGISYIAAAHSKTDYDTAQARQATSDARAEERYNRQEHLLTQPVKSAADLKQQEEVFADYAVKTRKERLRIGFRSDFSEDQARGYLRAQLRDTSNAWLALHPGDWDGAVKAGADWTEQWLRRWAIQRGRLRGQGGGNAGQPAAAGANPRR